MSQENSVRWDVGALSLPVPSAPGLTSFRPLDPACDILCDLFAAAITAEFGEHWSTVMVGTPLASTVPVQSKIRELADVEAMRQVKSTFPLLSVAPTEDPQTITFVTLDEKYLTTRWEVSWILGPLEIADITKISPVLRAAGKACISVVEEGGHKAYSAYVSNGYTMVQPVFQQCGFDSVRVVQFFVGGAKISETGPRYHAMTLILETTELIQIGERGGTLTGATVHLGTGDATGIARDLVIGDTSIPVQEG